MSVCQYIESKQNWAIKNNQKQIHLFISKTLLHKQSKNINIQILLLQCWIADSIRLLAKYMWPQANKLRKPWLPEVQLALPLADHIV